MNNNKRIRFTKIDLPLVLCSSSKARQDWLHRNISTIVYPVGSNVMTFQEPKPSKTPLPLEKPQHIDLVKQKWDVAYQWLKKWSGPQDTSWNPYIAIVCDTLVISQNHSYGKPPDSSALVEWYPHFFQNKIQIWSTCIASIWNHKESSQTITVHESAPLRFTKQGQEALIKLSQSPEASRLTTVAGGIDVEWFQKKGWVSTDPKQEDIMVGIPWQALCSKMTEKKWL
jgi:predicted house-cleaning NTP pyrophosphatase (Maf/HAM1 superfamily)